MKNETRHTPGPWILEGSYIMGPEAEEFPHSRPMLGSVIDCADAVEGEANANLLTASPDLLAALEKLERILEAGAIPSKSSAKDMAGWARAAIAKAKGAGE